VSARFVSHLLTPDQEHRCAASSLEFVEMIDDDRNVLKRFVTGNENLCSMYDPETKRQSETWLSPKKPKAQKVRMQKSRVKTMLNAFFDVKVIIHHEFVPEKQALKGNFYKEVIKKLIARVHRVRPEFQESGPWYLLHDNVWRILRAFFPNFWRNEGSPRYPIHPTNLIYGWLTFFIS
jgi:hypothetical protein